MTVATAAATTLATMPTAIAVAEIECKARGARSDQRANSRAGVENADQARAGAYKLFSDRLRHIYDMAGFYNRYKKKA